MKTAAPLPAATDKRLSGADAVAAIILTAEGRYLLQCRDRVPHIWYPGHWGCFGGGVESGEEPLAALKRELYEELELRFREAAYFTRFDFDLTCVGLRSYYRIYYVVQLAAGEESHLRLHEGSDLKSFAGEAIFNGLQVTPYDAFALYLHFSRKRLGPAV